MSRESRYFHQAITMLFYYSIKRYRLQVLQLNGSAWYGNKLAKFTHLSHINT